MEHQQQELVVEVEEQLLIQQIHQVELVVAEMAVLEVEQIQGQMEQLTQEVEAVAQEQLVHQAIQQEQVVQVDQES
jgi:hypothetical protein